MKFNSFTSFIDMGGYGFYVWLSYGLTFLLLGLLVFTSLSAHRKIKKDIKQKIKRKIKLREAARLSD